ncbi:nitroreductase family protein [Clostridia bacterium]|nr:nitroreductase family protein [Clostridia bacterium]
MKNVICNRRSIRKYSEDKVPFEVAKEVIEIARKAPSWKNQQCWHFVLVDDQKIKEQLADAIPEGNPGRKGITQAPYVIVVLADPEHSGNLDGKPYYLVDGGIVFSTLMLAAAERGLGTCFVGWVDEESAKKACNVPENYRLIGITPLGVAQYMPEEKPRKEFEELTTINAFGKED